jgi:hypothetical protein
MSPVSVSLVPVVDRSFHVLPKASAALVLYVNTYEVYVNVALAP